MTYRESFRTSDAARAYHASLKRRIDWALWEQLIAPDVRVILEEIRQTGAVDYLDFACGTGRVLAVSKNFFPNAVAIDISPEMVEYAMEQHPEVSFVVGDVTRQTDTLEGQFDCVTMFRFLLNAEPELRQHVIQRIGEHVREGGYLIGNIHLQSLSVSGLLAWGASSIRKKQISHMSRKQTEDLLADAGFLIESWRGYRVLPTLQGRAVLGTTMQIAAEQLCRLVRLGRWGADHLFVARKVEHAPAAPRGDSL